MFSRWLIMGKRTGTDQYKRGIMEIKVTQEGTHAEFAIEGSLNTTTSPQIEKFVNELYDKGVKNIDVNMGACDFVSSAGLRVIVGMQKRAMAGGSLVFHDVTPDVMEVLQMTGFDRILTID